jgi:hypothetical protein
VVEIKVHNLQILNKLNYFGLNGKRGRYEKYKSNSLSP